MMDERERAFRLVRNLLHVPSVSVHNRSGSNLGAIEMRLSATFHDKHGVEFDAALGLSSLGGETGPSPSRALRRGEGEPIVFVPGLAGSWQLVRPLARRLAESHEVILIGWGDECLGGRPWTTIGDYARELARVLHDLRLERPVVFGASFGGAVALELAVEQPGLIGELVVTGTPARYRTGLGHRVARNVLDRYELPRDNPFVNQFFNILHGGPPRSVEEAEFIVRNCWRTDQVVMARRLRALEDFDVEARLWRADVPTLVVAGSKDVVTSPRRQRELAEALPDARFDLINGAGHVGFITHADEVAIQVREHLRSRQRSLR